MLIKNIEDKEKLILHYSILKQYGNIPIILYGDLNSDILGTYENLSLKVT